MIKVKRARLAGGPKWTSKLPLGTAQRRQNKISTNTMEIDKEGMINEAGDEKDELEQQEASVQWWIYIRNGRIGGMRQNSMKRA
jgi:hypothetical protein